jgi:hypothetical protein
MFIEMMGLRKSWAMDPVNTYQIIEKRRERWSEISPSFFREVYQVVPAPR